MAAEAQFRCDVAGPEALAALRDAALPPGLRSDVPLRSFHRDIYLDTTDQTLLARRVSCRVRIRADDRRVLTLFIGGGPGGGVERYESEVPELDPRQALEGTSDPARRLRGLVDPAVLKPRIELEVERWSRTASAGLLRRTPRFAFLYDASTIRHGGVARSFEELQVRRISPGSPHLEAVAQALERQHGLRPIVVPRHERAAQLFEVLAAEVAARMLSAQTAVVLLALEEGKVAFLDQEGSFTLPVARGSGEEAARHLLRYVTGSGVGDLSLLGSLPPSEDRDGLEVWVARRIRGGGEAGPTRLSWIPAAEAAAKVGTPEIRAPETLAALAVATRANLLGSPARDSPERAAPIRASTPRATPASVHRVAATRAKTDLPPEHFLNAELAQLAFNERVLEMAEDPGTPLAERLRFLAILSGNLDEFFAVRVGALKAALLEGSTTRGFDGMTARQELEAITARVPPLLERQARCVEECLAAAGTAGVRLRRWDELDDAARAALTAHFQAELLPVLTPRAVTMSPGHPFPVIPQLMLTFGVVLQDVRTGPVHFASLPLRTRLDRFQAVPGSADLIPVEEVVRANIQAFYPDRPVEGAWLFRITRAAELDVNEEEAGDLLQAIEEEVKRRPGNAPVRVELERSMPAFAREMILRELRFERRGVTALLGPEDFYEADPLLDLTALRDLAARLPADQSFPPFHAKRPLPADRSLFELIDQGDLLFHHPYEDFSATVVRFLEEAASDPEVVALKMTLYRIGDRSPLVEALIKAAERGKDVAVFVELKARFDESRNVGWVRRLEEAGAQVIYGLVGHKIHAKVTLVVRRTPQGLRRYAHIATGNYNVATAKYYTDLGVLTADPEATADLTDLFNQLTGSSRAPGASSRRLLIAPATMLKSFVDRIEREIAHVAGGRAGRIRAQLNGLEDPEVIGALYRASTAGVEVDLIIRTLCVLRPGVPGVSERIRVRSVLGRFLEHERIYHFGNGGEDEYLIGSADWRPRNLRRRVEVVTPVRAPAHVARLDALLSALLSEPSAWILEPDGTYVRRARPSPEHPHLHDRLLS
jgi:polyphosphate kinase